MKTCPFCGEQIQDSAKKCRFCGEWLDVKNKFENSTEVNCTKKASRKTEGGENGEKNNYNGGTFFVWIIFSFVALIILKFAFPNDERVFAGLMLALPLLGATYTSYLARKSGYSQAWSLLCLTAYFLLAGSGNGTDNIGVAGAYIFWSGIGAYVISRKLKKLNNSNLDSDE